ncbi:hypothetical protein ACOSQ3_015602 [Xanthoceras sorbifolium]
MSRDIITESPESDVTTSMNFDDTELTLGLPGGGKSCPKRGFIETVDLNNIGSDHDPADATTDTCQSRVSGIRTCQATKAQVIGWPPVRSSRKKALEKSKLVKVAVDGAPYLRKVDLHLYSSYQELFTALEDIFTCFTIHGNSVKKERKIMGPMKGMEYVPTYEDKEDDWMLLGDVPWKMFIESCKRIRLMKSSERLLN